MRIKYTRVCLENLKGRDQSEDRGEDGVRKVK
jgi:hypothetical protein